MSIYRLLFAAAILAIAACANPNGPGASPICTLDPEDNHMVCPVTTSAQ